MITRLFGRKLSRFQIWILIAVLCALFFSHSTYGASREDISLPQLDAQPAAFNAFSLQDPPLLGLSATDSPHSLQPSSTPWLNMTDRIQLSSGLATGSIAKALANGDFNEDGAPDLVVASANSGRGVVGIYAGKAAALFSMQNNRAPFSSAIKTSEIPEAPDWIFAGDFNADDHLDLVAAAKGSESLYWLEGDGKGGFSKLHTIELDGPVTALIAGEINRPDLLTDVIIGVQGKKNPQVLVYESPKGAFADDPETFDVDAPVSALALGQLDDSYEYDLAAATGSNVVIFHGRDRNLTLDAPRRATAPKAAVESINMGGQIADLATGNFTGDNRSELAVLYTNGALQMLDRNGAQLTPQVVRTALSGFSKLFAGAISGGPHQNLIATDSQGAMQSLAFMDGALSATSLQDSESIVAALPMRLNGDALEDLVVLTQGSADTTLLISAPAATLTVNTLLDTPDATPGDGICDDGSGNCTLRAAIQESNALAGSDTIAFNIPGMAPFTITPATELPAITSPVLINGTTQPGATSGVWPPALLIELNCSAVNNCLTIDNSGSGSDIRGLVINRALTAGVVIVSSNNNIVEYNFIGTDTTGTIDQGNAINAILLVGDCSNNKIGGTTAGARNLLSGNATGSSTGNVATILEIGGATGIAGTLIQGNYFGTDVLGTTQLPNTVIAEIGAAARITNNIVGGVTPGSRNIISANNRQDGVLFQGAASGPPDVTGNIFAGNLIGLDASGTVNFGNANTGIRIFRAGSQNNTVGGTVPAARNIISGNQSNNVSIQDGAANQIVEGNYIGTNLAGTAAISGAVYGVHLFNAAGNTIGGAVTGARNVISGSFSVGLYLEGPGTTGNVIFGNFIGTNASGSGVLANAYGIYCLFCSGNIIGSPDPLSRNVLSGNQFYGIALSSGGGNIVQGNFIGTSASGNTPLPNGPSGVLLADNGSTFGGRLPGEGNSIKFNNGNGVAVAGVLNSILGNSIAFNAGLGIDLSINGVTPNDNGDTDGGANGQQNFPVLTGITASAGTFTIAGTLNSITGINYSLDFYSSAQCDPTGFGEGDNYLGSATAMTGGAGNVAFTAMFAGTLNPGDVVTATATDPQGNTSEFSQCLCYAPTPVASNNGPICSGHALQLYASSITGATYSWLGPNGFTSNLQNPTVPNATTAANGDYTVTVTINGCTSAAAVTNVTVNESPSLPLTSLPDAMIGITYDHAIPATGGSGMETFNITDGSLPSGLTLTSDGHVAGTPATSGIFTIEVTVTDSLGCSDSHTYTLHVNCSAIEIAPLSLPNGSIGTPYDQTISATGGSGTVVFAVSQGSLPPGLTLSINGELTGTPTISGTFVFTVSVIDSFGCPASRTYTLNVNCASIAISPLSLPDTTVGTPYDQTISATGGAGSITFSVSQGSLPSGLTLGSDGQLSGTPTASGTFVFSISATDSFGCSAAQTYTLNISCLTIDISPLSLPNGTNGVPYNQTISATGGTGAITFSVTAAALPPGLTLANDGALTGTPDTSGTYVFTVTATDSFGCSANHTYTLNINCSTLGIFPLSLPDGTTGTLYNQTLSAQGGVGTVSFSVSQGSLPAGLSLASSGDLTGTPTASGSYVFTVMATDSFGCSASRTYTLNINCPTIEILPLSLPDGIAGTSYDQTIFAQGGAGAVGFSVSQGSLPSGMSLASNGALTGTPMAAGSYVFTVTATDSFGCQAARTYTLVVNCSSISVFPPTLADGIIGEPYSELISVLGGAMPYTFSVTQGGLPTGMSLNVDGTLTGTPAATGVFNFVVTVTDANGCSASAPYTVHINCADMTLQPEALPDLVPNSAYDATLSVSGGASPYTFAVTSGSLPPGLTLDANTGEISGTTANSGNFQFTITATDAAGCTATHDYTLQGCLYCDDFEDGMLNTSWTYTGPWSESGGNLTNTTFTGKARAVASPVYAGCTLCSFEATMQTAGGHGNKISFFGWYTDSKNGVELMIKEDSDRWILKQRFGGTIVAKAKGISPVDPGVFYEVRMTYDGTNFQVFVDSNLLMTVPAFGTPFGTAAFQVSKTTGSFGDISVN